MLQNNITLATFTKANLKNYKLKNSRPGHEPVSLTRSSFAHAVLKQKSLNIYNKIGVQTTKYWCSVGITIFSFFVSSNENLPNFIITPTVKCNFISMTKIVVCEKLVRRLNWRTALRNNFAGLQTRRWRTHEQP